MSKFITVKEDGLDVHVSVEHIVLVSHAISQSGRIIGAQLLLTTAKTVTTTLSTTEVINLINE